jgi:putative ABC transport system permease protein
MILKDIRYGIRSLARHPGFTAVALLTLALGIGANTAIFSVVNAVLLRPLPYADPERIVWLWDTIPQLPTAPTSLPEFLDWKQQNRSFEHLAAFQTGNMFIDSGDGTEDVPVGLVTPAEPFRIRSEYPGSNHPAQRTPLHNYRGDDRRLFIP